jgi:hypothetical protein
MLKSRQIPLSNKQWNEKAEAIRRKYNLQSKSEAVRYCIDKEYDEMKRDKNG